jgi:hypothetical protein
MNRNYKIGYAYELEMMYLLEFNKCWCMRVPASHSSIDIVADIDNQMYGIQVKSRENKKAFMKDKNTKEAKSWVVKAVRDIYDDVQGGRLPKWWNYVVALRSRARGSRYKDKWSFINVNDYFKYQDDVKKYFNFNKLNEDLTLESYKNYNK